MKINIVACDAVPPDQAFLVDMRPVRLTAEESEAIKEMTPAQEFDFVVRKMVEQGSIVWAKNIDAAGTESHAGEKP